jgi:hypothetical protein
VQADRPIVAAKSLQRRDLPALGADLAGERHVEQEHGDAQHDDGQHGAVHLPLADLLAQHLVRDGVGAAVGAGETVAVELPIERRKHRWFGGTMREPHRHRVERAFHVEGGGEPLAPDPEDAEALFVAHAAACRKDVLGREHDTDHLHRLALAVEQRGDARARHELVRFGEGLVDQYLVRTRRVDPRPPHQRQPVDARQPVQGQRDHAAGERGHALVGVEHHVERDGRLRLGHALYVEQLVRHGQRRALAAHERVRETRLLVVARLQPLERVVRGERADVAGDARRHHERDREHLAAQLPDVAQQLAVEHAYHVISSGLTLVALRVISAMRPSAIRITRSAIRAIGALCVITTAVVPSSALMRAIACNTILPVA